MAADNTTAVSDVSNKTSSGRLAGDVNEREFLDTLDKPEGDDDTDSDDNEDADGEDEAESSDEGKEESAGDESEPSDDDTEGDGEKEPKKSKEDEEADTEDEDDDDELNLDDQDEDTSLYQRLKARDKKIFKEIPGLRNVLFREQEFTKVFPSVEAGKEANELATTFVQFQRDIEGGDAGTFVEAISELGEEPLLEFSGNFLPSLLKKNEKVYYAIMAPEIKKVLRAAMRSDNEHIRASAKNLNYFLWQDSDVNADAPDSFKVKDKTERKPSKEESEAVKLQRQIADNFGKDTFQIATRKLKKIIKGSLEGFNLSERTLGYLVDDIFDRTTGLLKKDARHNGKMDLLWKKARASGYDSEGKERLITAFLSRAKEVVPKYRQQVLAENKLSAKEAKDKQESSGKKKEAVRIPASGTPGSGKPAGKIDPKKIDWSKTSERDVLDGKIVYKK